MPSTATITAYYSFSAGVRPRVSRVNNNFDVLRGHRIPIDPNTQTASDGSYDLGSSEHRFRNLYSQQINLEGLTSTTDIKIIPKSLTAGGFNILNGATTIGSWSVSGMLGSLFQSASIPDSTLVKQPRELLTQTFTSSTSLVVPTGTSFLIVEGCGGGGGGGGGDNAGASDPGGGGGGGGGAPICIAFLAVSPGQTLTVSIGAGGAGGAASSNGSTGSASSFSTFTFIGGVGGAAASGTTGGTSSSFILKSADGGAGGSEGGGSIGTTGTSGGGSQYSAGAAGGVFQNGSGGGGGGSSAGIGGAGGTGGIFPNGAGVAGSSAAANTGGGGGGGGGGGTSAGVGASGGAGGSGFIRVVYVKTPT